MAQYDPVDEYGRGFDAGYTAAVIAYRVPLPSSDVNARMGKRYAQGYNEGMAQWRKDSEK